MMCEKEKKDRLTTAQRSCLKKFFVVKIWSLLSELPEPNLFILALLQQSTVQQHWATFAPHTATKNLLNTRKGQSRIIMSTSSVHPKIHHSLVCSIDMKSVKVMRQLTQVFMRHSLKYMYPSLSYHDGLKTLAVNVIFLRSNKFCIGILLGLVCCKQ